jgi:hypothetical protein
MPLVKIDTSKPGQTLTTRGHRHPSNRYTINTHIRLPAAYAAKRDGSTVERGARQAGRTGTQKKRTLNDRFDSLADLLVKRAIAAGQPNWHTLEARAWAFVGELRGLIPEDRLFPRVLDLPNYEEFLGNPELWKVDVLLRGAG